MPVPDPATVQRIVDDALRVERWDQAAFLDRACGADAALRAAVDRGLREREQQSSVTAAPLTPPPGSARTLIRTVGPYEIERELGHGGMGVVYLALDTRLRRRVALKVLARDIANDESSRMRLRREAQLAAALSHPNLATVHALEEFGSELFLVTEYLEGPSLRHLLRQGPLPLKRVLDLAVQMVSGLAAAHAGRVIHRDLKPENIIVLPGGTLKILDFGLARLEGGHESSRVTQSGMVVGTAAYMSPEQANGAATDFRTDLFSFGLTVFEMASGRNPLEGPTLTATLAMRNLDFEPLSLAAVMPDCPRELDWIVATCLRKHPAQRFAATADVQAALKSLQAQLFSGVTPGPRPISAPAPSADPAVRWWKTHLAVISLVYAGMIYPAWHVRSWVPGRLGMPLLLLVLATAAAAVAMRLHLWFTHDMDIDELPALHARTRRVIRICDVLFAAMLAAEGVAIGIFNVHPEFALLFVLIAVVTLTASFVIEPTTERLVFRRSGILPPARPASVS